MQHRKASRCRLENLGDINPFQLTRNIHIPTNKNDSRDGTHTPPEANKRTLRFKMVQMRNILRFDMMPREGSSLDLQPWPETTDKNIASLFISHTHTLPHPLNVLVWAESRGALVSGTNKLCYWLSGYPHLTSGVGSTNIHQPCTHEGDVGACFPKWSSCSTMFSLQLILWHVYEVLSPITICVDKWLLG